MSVRVGVRARATGRYGVGISLRAKGRPRESLTMALMYTFAISLLSPVS